MKKKNLKNSIEEVLEVVNTLKATVEISSENGGDTTAINTLESSLRKVEKLKKEVVALKEKLRNKKTDLNLETETMWELVRTEKKLLKNKPQKETEKKEKSAKKLKKQKPEEKAEVSK